MFLVPLDSPGIEIQGIRTLDGDRTNIVYYSDVRVDDLYRIGEVNGGWTVMRSALDAEHGITEPESHGLQNISTMSEHGHADGRGGGHGSRSVVAERDDDSVKYRLGRSIARMEAAMSTPGMYGRVAHRPDDA